MLGTVANTIIEIDQFEHRRRCRTSYTSPMRSVFANPDVMCSKRVLI